MPENKQVKNLFIHDDYNSEITLFSYPIPYTETFKLDYSSPSINEVKVMVYDVLGKQVETRTFNALEMINQKFGANYNNGIYNVLIEQDGSITSTRIIKKQYLKYVIQDFVFYLIFFICPILSSNFGQGFLISTNVF